MKFKLMLLFVFFFIVITPINAQLTLPTSSNLPKVVLTSTSVVTNETDPIFNSFWINGSLAGVAEVDPIFDAFWGNGSIIKTGQNISEDGIFGLINNGTYLYTDFWTNNSITKQNDTEVKNIKLDWSSILNNLFVFFTNIDISNYLNVSSKTNISNGNIDTTGYVNTSSLITGYIQLNNTATAPACSVSNRGLIWYAQGASSSTPIDAISYWRLNETSGTNAVDGIDNNDGTYVGSPTPIVGPMGGGYKFAAGTGQYVSVPGNANLNLNAHNLSIIMWLNTTPQSDSFFPLWAAYNIGSYDGSALLMSGWCDESNPGTLCWYSSLGGTSNSTGSVNDGVWHFIAVTVSDSHVVFYIDGISSGDNAINGQPGDYAGVKAIGNSPGGGPMYDLSVEMSDFAIFDRVLTPEEISALYACSTKYQNTVETNDTLMFCGKNTLDNYAWRNVTYI